MGNFFDELKRRHVYRVAAAYALVAWVLLQLVNNLAPAFNLPNWAITFVVILLIVGFPFALLFAWIQQLVPADGSAARTKTGAFDWALLGALALVIGIFAYQQLAPSRATVTVQQQAGVAAAHAAAASPAGAISVAVLPFANLSGDPSQEFFSDGMTEEITTALAKIPDLRVVARESAFQFKGEKKDSRAVGQALGATHLIEGSLRKVGDRVRITAQLVKADDGVNVWANSYDRQLTDVFAIQEDIARAITTSLRMPLGLKPGENLVNNRSIDPEGHQQYLRARALIQGRLSGGLKAMKDAIALLEQVAARNPDFAPAWALLASAHANLPNYLPVASVSVDEIRRAVQSSRDNSEPAARKAIQLDPDNADGYLSLASMQLRAGKFLLAEDLYSKVLALDPYNPEALAGYGHMLAQLGYVKKGLAMQQQAHALETLLPISNRNLAEVLWLNGEDDAALAILKSLNNIRLSAMVHAGAGRFNEAADTLLSVPSGSLPSDALDALKEAVRLLRMAPTSAGPEHPVPLGPFDFVYLFVGAPGRVLVYYERNVEAGWMANAQTVLLWHPSYAPARKMERFKSLVRAAGMVDYWRAKDWPQFCHPTTGDDFVCE